MPGFYYYMPMTRTYLFYVCLALSLIKINAQVIYAERFNTLSLGTGTNSSNNSLYYFADVPGTMSTINTGNLSADTSSANYPFRSNGQKQKAWLAYSNPSIAADTFAVSTSWLNPSGVADAWLITPVITPVSLNSVLTWNAIAPDLINADGYEVYVTTNTTGTVTASDFTVANRLFSISAENATWTNRGVSLANYAGQSIRIGFRNNSNNKYQLWLDDIVVENISNGFDVSTTQNKVYKYSTVNTVNTITATFKNNGYVPVTNLTINYKAGLGAVVTETQTLSSPLNYLDSRDLTFSMPFISSSAAYYDLKIWVSGINGQADQMHANDTITGSITLSSSVPDKKVLIEEFTSTACGWCPDGYAKLSSVVATQTNVIAVSHHVADNMATAESASLAGVYGGTLPSGVVDQYYFTARNSATLEQTEWSTYATQRAQMKVPASVTITNVSYNAATRQIDATVSTTFVGDVKGDYRLNLYIKENNIYGPAADVTDNGWNQHNALFNIQASPYYGLGNYLDPDTYLMLPADYKHQYVVDYVADGTYGASGIVPANGGTMGQTYTKTYSYTLPVPATGEFRYNPDNIYLVGVLLEYNSNNLLHAVINAAESKLNTNPETAVGLNEHTRAAFVSVYPNPATDIVYLNYYLNTPQQVTVNVYNILGEQVYIEQLNAGSGNINHALSVGHLPQGAYTIELKTGKQSMTQKLTVIK